MIRSIISLVLAGYVSAQSGCTPIGSEIVTNGGFEASPSLASWNQLYFSTAVTGPVTAGFNSPHAFGFASDGTPLPPEQGSYSLSIKQGLQLCNGGLYLLTFDHRASDVNLNDPFYETFVIFGQVTTYKVSNKRLDGLWRSYTVYLRAVEPAAGQAPNGLPIGISTVTGVDNSTLSIGYDNISVKRIAAFPTASGSNLITGNPSFSGPRISQSIDVSTVPGRTYVLSYTTSATFDADVDYRNAGMDVFVLSRAGGVTLLETQAGHNFFNNPGTSQISIPIVVTGSVARISIVASVACKKPLPACGGSISISDIVFRLVA